MPTPRPSRTAWLFAVVLFVAFALVVLLVLRRRADAGQGLPPYSVYSGDVNGLAQTAEVLRKIGLEPVALTRPVQQARLEGLLVLVEPASAGGLLNLPDVNETNAKALLAWVERGNTLLLIGTRSTLLHTKLKVDLVPPPAGAGDAALLVNKIAVSGYTEDVDAVELEDRTTLRAEGSALPLWWVHGQPGAVVVPHGRGKVLVAADPSLLTHRGLLRADNVLFLYNVAVREARHGRVYFDEYHHGLRSGGGYWGYLRYHNQHGMVLQLLVLAGLAVWSMAFRLGPAVPLPKAGAADAVDYAAAVARIYQRAGAAHLLAKLLVRDFLDGLTAHLRLRRHAALGDILAAWKNRHPAEPPEQVRRLVEAANELHFRAEAKDRLPTAELLTWAREFDGFLGRAKKKG